MQTITAHIKLGLPRRPALRCAHRLVRLLLAHALLLPSPLVLRIHRLYVQQQRPIPRPEHPRTRQRDAPARLRQIETLCDLDRPGEHVRVVSPEVLLRRDRIVGALERVERDRIVDRELDVAPVPDAARVLAQERDLDVRRSGGGVQDEVHVDVTQIDGRGEVQFEDVLVPGGRVRLETPRFRVLVAVVVYALIMGNSCRITQYKWSRD